MYAIMCIHIYIYIYTYNVNNNDNDNHSNTYYDYYDYYASLPIRGGLPRHRLRQPPGEVAPTDLREVILVVIIIIIITNMNINYMTSSFIMIIIIDCY